MNKSSVASSTAATEARRRIEPWPLGIVLFLGVVAVVNGILVFLAADSWNGVITEGHYEKGLAFNEVIAAQRTQDALGWQATLEAPSLTHNRQGAVTFTLRDAQGRPLTGLTVSAEMLRPVTVGHDLVLRFAEQAPGRYLAHVTPLLAGAWDLKVEAVGDAGRYRMQKRFRVAE